MRIDEVTSTDVDKLVTLFGDLLMICKKELQLDSLPKLKWVTDGSFSKQYHSFGSFQPGENIVTVSLTNRHVIDMMRTLAHELVHYKQMLDGRLGPNSGETGSPIENEANAMAGVIMRKFDHMHPEAFSIKPILIETAKNNLNKMLGEGTPLPPKKPAPTARPPAPAPSAPPEPEDNFLTGVAKGIGSAADPRNWLSSGPDKQLQQNVKNVMTNPNQGNIGNVVGQGIVNNAPFTGNIKSGAAAAGSAVDTVKSAAQGDVKGALNNLIDTGTNALGAVLPIAGTAAGAVTNVIRNSTPAEPGTHQTDQAIRELNELLAENISSTGKLVIFDIDDTLVHTATKIHVVSNGQVTKELSSHEFTHYKLQPGESFDFGRFRNAKEFFEKSRPIIPMINQLKRDIDTGNKVVMITARADFDDKELFLDTFRKFGIDMGKVHVYRAGNMSNSIAVEEKKAIIIRKLLNNGNYSMAIMYDDSVPNLKGFVRLKKEYPGTKFYAWHVSLEGKASELERTDELAVF